MAGKKVKTVKELNLEVDKLTEKIKELEVMLKELKKVIKTQSLNQTISKGLSRETNVQNVIKTLCCYKCEEIFTKKCDLIQHIKEKHTRELNCKQCNFKCSAMIELEMHLLKSHHVEKDLQCTKCEKKKHL